MKEKVVSSLVVFLGKVLDRISPFLCGKQVVGLSN